MTLGALVIIAGLIVAVLAIGAVFRSGYREGLAGDTAIPAAAAGALDGPGTFEIEVVGESHYQPALESVCGGRSWDSAEKNVQATLILEDQNIHDNQAVRIDVESLTVGYLPRDTARSYRRRLREAGIPHLGGHCNAVIRGGWDRGPNDRGFFGIWLDLPLRSHGGGSGSAPASTLPEASPSPPRGQAWRGWLWIGLLLLVAIVISRAMLT